jgi:hypothetical protein
MALAIPARLDRALNQEIEGFAELIAGASPPAFLLDCARRTAEVRRIRRVRLLAWSKVETDKLKRDNPLPGSTWDSTCLARRKTAPSA